MGFKIKEEIGMINEITYLMPKTYWNTILHHQDEKFTIAIPNAGSSHKETFNFAVDSGWQNDNSTFTFKKTYTTLAEYLKSNNDNGGNDYDVYPMKKLLPLIKTDDVIKTNTDIAKRLFAIDNKDNEHDYETDNLETKFRLVPVSYNLDVTTVSGTPRYNEEITVKIQYVDEITNNPTSDTFVYFDGFYRWITYATPSDRENDNDRLAEGKAVVSSIDGSPSITTTPYKFKFSSTVDVYFRGYYGNGTDEYISESIKITEKGTKHFIEYEKYQSAVSTLQIMKIQEIMLKKITELESRIVDGSHIVTKSLTNAIIDFVPNDDNSSKFTLTGGHRKDDIFTFTWNKQMDIDVTVQPNETHENGSFEITLQHQYFGEIDFGIILFDTDGNEHKVANKNGTTWDYGDIIHVRYAVPSAIQKKLSKVRARITLETATNTKFKAGIFYLSGQKEILRDVDTFPKVNLIEINGETVKSKDDVSSESLIREGLSALFDAHFDFAPNEDNKSRYAVVGGTVSGDKLTYDAGQNTAYFDVPADSAKEYTTASISIIGNEDKTNSGVEIYVTMISDSNTPPHKDLPSQTHSILRNGAKINAIFNVPRANQKNNTHLRFNVKRLGGDPINGFTVDRVFGGKKNQDANIIQVAGNEITLADLQPSSAGTALSKSDVEDAATDAMKNLPGDEKAKFGVKNTKDEIKTATAEAITGLDGAEKAKFGQKNTETEIKDAATKALTDLPDPVKATYGEDITLTLNTIENEVEENQNKIDDVKKETAAIKSKTDKLQFGQGDDVKATLEGEQVTADLSATNAKIDKVKQDTESLKTLVSNVDAFLKDRLDMKLSDLKAQLTAIAADATTIRKIQTNNYKIAENLSDAAEHIGTIYDDDGVTIFRQFVIRKALDKKEKDITWR